jgi:hypothetical protein
VVCDGPLPAAELLAEHAEAAGADEDHPGQDHE